MAKCGIQSNSLSCAFDRGHSGVCSWIGLTHDDYHRYYFNGDGPLVSVTTALKVYDKSDVLVGWASRQVAKSALLHHELLTEHLTHEFQQPTCPVCMTVQREWQGPMFAAERWLKGMPGREKDEAAAMGTKVHRYAEQNAKGELLETIPAYALPFIESYQAWRERYQPIYTLIEFGVFHQTYRYGGTGDLICQIESGLTGGFPGTLETWLIDLKTGGDLAKGTGVYPEMGLQLAGYGGAQTYSGPGDPELHDMPKIDRFGILQVRPDGYRFVPFTVTNTTWKAWLNVLATHRWSKTELPSIMGRALNI